MTELICDEAKEHFQYLLELTVQCLGEHGYNTANSIEKCKNFDQLMREIISLVPTPFPKLLKLEMICYHIQLLRENVMAVLKK